MTLGPQRGPGRRSIRTRLERPPFIRAIPGLPLAGVPLSGLQRDQGVEPEMRPTLNGLCLFAVVVLRRDQDIERVRCLRRDA